jgi:hypothetical protein
MVSSRKFHCDTCVKSDHETLGANEKATVDALDTGVITAGETMNPIVSDARTAPYHCADETPVRTKFETEKEQPSTGEILPDTVTGKLLTDMVEVGRIVAAANLGKVAGTHCVAATERGVKKRESILI